MKSFFLVAPWIFASLSHLAFAGEVPPVASLASMSYAGSACPAGSLAGGIYSDKNDLQIYTDGIYAATGPGVPLSDSRKVCQISLDIRSTPGWAFALGGIRSTVYLALDRGQTLDFLLRRYSTAPGSMQILAHALIQGPVDGDLRIEDYTDQSRNPLIWSPCGLQRSVNLQLAVRLVSRFPARGMINFPNANLEDSTFHLPILWRRCP